MQRIDKSRCSKRCSCRKLGLLCNSFCKSCKGRDCLNTELIENTPVDPQDDEIHQTSSNINESDDENIFLEEDDDEDMEVEEIVQGEQELDDVMEDSGEDSLTSSPKPKKKELRQLFFHCSNKIYVLLFLNVCPINNIINAL